MAWRCWSQRATPGVPVLRRAVRAFRGADVSGEEGLRWFWLAHIVAGNLWNELTIDNGRHLELARRLGAMATLPLALSVRVGGTMEMEMQRSNAGH